MKYPHIVFLNGVVYQAGQEVPDTHISISPKTTEENEVVVETTSDSEVEDKPTEKQYTQHEILKMKSADVKKLALELGFHDIDDIPIKEIRRNIIQILKL